MTSGAEIIRQDEAARAARGEIKFFGDIVARLMCVKFELTDERLFVESVNRQLNQAGAMVNAFQVRRIKDLAWKFRRQLPAHARPKLPPHDPIVQEMVGRK